MNVRLPLLAATLTAALLGQTPAVQRRIPPSYKDLKFPALHQVKPPAVERAVLPNGLTLFLVEDHELPLVQAQALIRIGDRNDPAAKTGLADIALRVMRTGGSTARSGDSLDKELDRLAASVETGSSEDSSSASMFVLKEDTDKGLEILADLLQHPAFPEDKIELAKLELRDSIARRNDDPDGIQSRETERLLYGKNSPYGTLTEYATLNAISRADLAAFHAQYFEPENIILGVWGDFKAADMRAKVEKSFGAWARGGKPRPPVPAVDPSLAAKPGVYLIEKDDVNQSPEGMSVLIGKRNDPDYQALVVMTYILGGNFGARLTDRIRTREGLAYEAYAHYAAGMDHPGVWTAKIITKTSTTVRGLELMRQELERIKQAEVTDAELSFAKDSILKGEAFDFDSTGKIIGRLMQYEYYGYPSDFLEKNRAAIAQVTKADVLRVAKKYLNLDQFQTLVLGNSKEFDKPLSTLGPVTNVDITIPEPPKPPANQ